VSIWLALNLKAPSAARNPTGAGSSASCSAPMPSLAGDPATAPVRGEHELGLPPQGEVTPEYQPSA
jgi:hypothetical protein